MRGETDGRELARCPAHAGGRPACRLRLARAITLPERNPSGHVSPSRPPNDPLREILHEAESELSKRLHEACVAEAQGVANESTEEIRKLEDTLLAAAMAAERTITMRRHLREASSAERSAAPDLSRPDAPREQPATGSTAPAHDRRSATRDEMMVREFADETGRGWRAWPVIPDLRRSEVSRRSLGEFQDGWICFEALDNSGRRRLPGGGRRWSDLSAAELPQLLARAITVPASRERADGKEPPRLAPDSRAD